MFTVQCDECKMPIQATDNHIEIGRLKIVEDKSARSAEFLHFCCKKCLDSWYVKNANRPRIAAP